MSDEESVSVRLTASGRQLIVPFATADTFVDLTSQLRKQEPTPIGTCYRILKGNDIMEDTDKVRPHGGTFEAVVTTEWPKRYTGSLGHRRLNEGRPISISIVMHSEFSGEWIYLDQRHQITIALVGSSVRMMDTEMELSGEVKGQRIYGIVIRGSEQDGGFGLIPEELKVGVWAVYTNERHQVGSGTFGFVFHCRRQNDPPISTGVEYVAKLMQLTPGRAKIIQREANILFELSSLCHNNILEVKDIAIEQEEVILVLPFMRCGNLGRFLSKDVRRSLWASEAAHTFRQVLCAVEFLHGHKIMHRDLKPENILVSDYQQINGWTLFVKVSDFGCSRIGDVEPDGAVDNASLVGTKPYMAPEIYYRVDSIGYGPDYWSLGVICYYLLNAGSRWSFPSCDEARLFPYELSEERLTSEINANIEGDLRHIVAGLLCRLECDRWTATQARQVLDRQFPQMIDISQDDLDVYSSDRNCVSLSSRSSFELDTHNDARAEVAQRLEVVDEEVDTQATYQKARASALRDDEELAKHLQATYEEHHRELSVLCDEEFAQYVQECEDAKYAHQLEQEFQQQERQQHSCRSRSRSRSRRRGPSGSRIMDDMIMKLMRCGLPRL